MKKKASVFLNIVLLSFPEYIAGFSVILILIFLSKTYSLSIIGEFTYANTVGQILAAIFGVASLTIMRRDFSMSPLFRDKFLLTIFAYRALIAIGIMALALFLFSLKLLNFALLVMIVARLLDSLSETNYYSLLSENNFKLFSLLKSSHYVFLILLVIAIGYNFNLSIDQICLIFLSNSLFWFIFNFLMVYFTKVKNTGFHWKNTYLVVLLNRTLPLLLSTSIYILSTRVNIFVIKKVCNSEDFGVFSIVLSIIGLLTIFTSAISSLLLNKQIEIYKQSDEIFKKHLIKYSYLFLVIGFLVYVIMYFLSNYVNLIFKNYPEDKIYLLQIGLLSVIPYFLQIPINYFLTIVDKNKIALIFASILLLVAIIIYTSFTYLYALEGAIYSLVLYNFIWYMSLITVAIFMINKKINNKKRRNECFNSN